MAMISVVPIAAESSMELAILVMGNAVPVMMKLMRGHVTVMVMF